MIIIWMVTHYSLYLIQFVLPRFERIWLTAFAVNISDLIGYITAGPILYKLGPKISLSGCFMLSFAGGVAIATFGLRYQQTWFFPVLVAIVKLGIAGSFQIIYIAHTWLFPTLFAATAIGWLQFAACLVSGLGALQVNLSDSPITPIVTLTVLALASAILSLFLITSKHEEDDRSLQDK